jgi:hypothetical protein
LEVLEGFEDRFGYRPDTNVVVAAAGQAGSRLGVGLQPGAVAPPRSVVEFFDAVEEVSLPDVWNGYFLGPVSHLIARYAKRDPRWLMLDGEQVEVLVIGSDGGGALYVAGREAEGPVFRIEEGTIRGGVLSTVRDSQVQMLATSFPGFLDLFASGLESFAAGAAAPSF